MFRTITTCGIEVVSDNEFLKCEEFDGMMLKDNLDNENILVVLGYKYQDNGIDEHDVKIIGKISWDKIHAATEKETVSLLKEEAIKMFCSETDLSELDCPKIKMDDVLAQRIMMISEE